jgi:hypothetical protein
VLKCASAREKQSKSVVVVLRISSLKSNHSHNLLTLHKGGFPATNSNFLFRPSLLLLLFIVYYFGIDSHEEVVRNFVVVVVVVNSVVEFVSDVKEHVD